MDKGWGSDRLIENIVECKDLDAACSDYGIDRLIENIVECKVLPPVPFPTVLSVINRKHSGM